MRRLSTAIFPLALAALVAALTFWLQRAANPDSPTRKADKRHDPDYIIDTLTVRHFDAGGSIKQALTANTMTHFPDDNSTHITRPDLTYYLNQSTTQLTAKTALVSQDNKKVFLQGDVRLTKPPKPDIPMTLLQTEALTVFPDDDQALGNLPVTITRGQSFISGSNIQYNGRSEVTVMSGRVKGTFYRTTKS